MSEYTPLRAVPETAGYKPGDCLVLIGELFGRGYANGLIEEARRLGMTVIGTPWDGATATEPCVVLHRKNWPMPKHCSVAEPSSMSPWKPDLTWKLLTANLPLRNG